MCNEHNSFDLKAACKECPFRKGNGYLRPERILQIVNYMKFDDQLFPCHKTVSKDAREPYDEAMEQIDDELDWIIDKDIDPIELENMRKQLEIKYNIPELLENVKFALMNSEKICAGWMILAKKEKIILNNFRIRLALMTGQLTLDQFKNEELIYENEAEAIYAHSKF